MSLFTLLANSGDLTIEGAPGEKFTIKSPLRSEISDLSGLVNVLLSFLFPLATVILFAMIVYAGFMYVTSEGNPDKLKQARAAITASVIGMALLFIAFFVIRIVASIFGFQGGILPS